MAKPSSHRSGVVFGSGLAWCAAFYLYFFAVTIPSAHAYIDPGTGSYVFQVAVGAVLGAAVAVKLFWKRIWAFLTRRKARDAAGKSTGRD